MTNYNEAVPSLFNMNQNLHTYDTSQIFTIIHRCRTILSYYYILHDKNKT